MRIAELISTGKFLEAQSNAVDGVLTSNSVAAGYSEKDIQEREVTDDEFKVIMSTVNPVLEAKPTLDDLIEVVKSDTKLKATLDTVIAKRSDRVDVNIDLLP